MEVIYTEIKYAATTDISADALASFALGYEWVLGARAFQYDGKFVVATLTAPFYLKSERDSAKNELLEDLRSYASTQDVILTFDVEVYRNIRESLTEQQMQRLLDIAQKR